MTGRRKLTHANFQNDAQKSQSDLAKISLADVITLVPLSELKPWARNARTHSKKQIGQIAASIEEFGFTNPILIDQSQTILAGHGRVKAAKALGLTTVPCVRLDHLSDTQKRAYIIADNKLALNAGWDDELLAEELQSLLGVDLGFDLTVTGFSIPEIDGLIANNKPEKPGNPVS